MDKKKVDIIICITNIVSFVDLKYYQETWLIRQSEFISKSHDFRLIIMVIF